MITGRYRGAAVIFLSSVLVAYIGLMALRQTGGGPVENEALSASNIPYIGKLLFTDYLFPFEVVSMILLVALIGVVVLVKRDAKEAAG